MPLETKNLCVKLMDIVHSNEKEVAYIERLVHMFYRCICCLKDTVAAQLRGDGSVSSSGNS
jgi:hypothetical protein